MPVGLPPKNKLPAKKRAAVKALYERGVAVSAIADKQGVSRRTVADWAKQGAWQRPADRAAAAAGGSGPAGDGGDGGDQRAVVDPDTIDVDQILAETIADLRSAMTASLKNFDYRPVPQLAMAVVKTLEAWAARHPVTPAQLAQLALQMSTTPEDFQDELFKAWRLGNGGN